MLMYISEYMYLKKGDINNNAKCLKTRKQRNYIKVNGRECAKCFAVSCV